MNCPNDGTTLLMSERQGIEIDYCPECRGVWLDRGELDKILDQAKAESVPAPPNIQPVQNAQPTSQQEQRYGDQTYGDRSYGDRSYDNSSYGNDSYDNNRRDQRNTDPRQNDPRYNNSKYRKKKSPFEFLGDLFEG
ncbi:MAG: zf-TFIIB domain-containing protein [Leucobacter sp.]